MAAANGQPRNRSDSVRKMRKGEESALTFHRILFYQNFPSETGRKRSENACVVVPAEMQMYFSKFVNVQFFFKCKACV